MLLQLLLALAAVTTKKIKSRMPVGNEVRTITEVTLDNSYAEGGEPLTATQLGLKRVYRAHVEILNGPESEEWIAYATYTALTSKVHLFSAKTGKELVATKDMSKVVLRVTAWGNP